MCVTVNRSTALDIAQVGYFYSVLDSKLDSKKRFSLHQKVQSEPVDHPGSNSVGTGVYFWA